MKNKVAVFIDGANLYASAKHLNMNMDYSKIITWAGSETGGKVIRSMFYTALSDDEAFVALRPMVDWLSYNGFVVVTKPIKEFTDAQGRRKIKGNMDIEIAVDAMELAPHVDTMFFFTGDGDFRRVIESIQRRGVHVVVVSALEVVADELRRQADRFIDLQDIAHDVCRPSRAEKSVGGNHGIAI